MFEPSGTTLFLIILVLYYVVFIFKNWKIVKFAAKEKGSWIPILPIVGNTYIVAISGQRRNLVSAMQWYAKYVSYPFGVWHGFRYVYTSNTPSEIKTVLSHHQCCDKSTIYEGLKYPFRKTLVLIPYEMWKRRRPEYTRGNKPNVVKSFFPVFSQECCKLLEEIKNKKGNIAKITNEYTFNTFFRTSLGLEERQKFVDVRRFAELAFLTQEELLNIMLDPITPPEVWHKFYPAGRRAQKLVEESDAMLTKVLKAKKEHHIDTLANAKDDEDFYDFVEVMLYKEELELLLGDLSNLAIAAADTTGNSLPFTFTLLGMHPEIQEILYDEVISVVGLDKEIFPDDLLDLKYTEAVICESLRLFPIIPQIARKVTADVDIGTKVLPEGIEFVVDIFHLHRDPRFWKDPLKFDPTRFLPENVSKIEPYSYIPFSKGPRACLGKQQAMALQKITLANVVRKFKMISNYKTINEINLTSCITMRSEEPLDCHFILR